MINKNIKTLIKGLGFTLAFIIFMPIGAFAGTHTVNNWADYKDKVEADIIKQETEITINFTGSEIFSTEVSARRKMNSELQELIDRLPKHLKKLNILNTDNVEKIQTAVKLNSVSNATLNSITHIMDYKSSKEEIKDLKELFNGKINTDIKFKSTDYEKIKSAYDYIKGLDREEEPIKRISIKHGVDGDTFLFAMMMAELEYDNDIATSKDLTLKWNLVKVQGKWYHVYIKNDRFLISKENTTWNRDEHKDKEDNDFASQDYNEDDSEILQLEYEIALIKKEVVKTRDEITNLSEGITMNQIKETKAKAIIIEGIIESYRERANLLGDRVSVPKDSLASLNNSISFISNHLESKKETIIAAAIEKAEDTFHMNDILIAKEAITMIKNHLSKDQMDALSIAIEAMENAEDTRLEGDVELAREAIGDVKNELKERLESRINKIKSIQDSVTHVENNIKSITTETKLSEAIEDVEGVLKSVEIDVKNIKELDIRTEQQDRIIEIKLAITAIKAVEKAETEPLKITNVTTAVKSVEKLSVGYWGVGDYEVIKILKSRLQVVMDRIAASELESNAIKAVDKAEKSMKDTDIESAKEYVELYENSDIEPDASELNDRINAIIAINKLEIGVINYLQENSQGNRDSLGVFIANADTSIIKLIEGSTKEKYGDRLAVARATRTAIDKIKLAEAAAELEKDAAIKVAEESIPQVSDSKIKKLLENKLNYIISQREANAKLNAAEEAVKSAILSLTEYDNGATLDVNIELVNEANEKVKALPNGNIKKQYQTIIKELNNVIKAKQMLEAAENKLANGTLTLKDVTGVEKIVGSLEKRFKEHKPVNDGMSLEERTIELRSKLGEKEAAELLEKAENAVAKAEETKLVKDITAAKKAIALVKDEDKKNDFMVRLEELEVAIGKELVENAEGSALYNSKSLSKDITAAEKSVDLISNNQGEEKIKLNDRIRALKSYVLTVKALETAEKTRNEKNVNTVKEVLADFEVIVGKVAEEDKAIYTEIIEKIKLRIEVIESYLTGEDLKVTEAQVSVALAESKMTKDTDPEYEFIIDAQVKVNLVTDKTTRGGLQKRIDAIQVAQDAKLEVMKVEAYPTEKGVKDAEKALNKIDGRYNDIIEDLGLRIAKLKNQLNIFKKVIEATTLVEKAIDSRKEGDIVRARFAVGELEGLADDSYEKLGGLLDALVSSMENETADQTSAIKEIEDALEDKENGVFALIGKINKAILQVSVGQEKQEEDIEVIYGLIKDARFQILIANAALGRITDQGQFPRRIVLAKSELDLSEDNLNVEDAVRLINIASSSVNRPRDEVNKFLAIADIATARRAIDKITHKENKDIKKTVTDTLNVIERKLTSDNDQESIDIAMEMINDAADILATAVKDDKVTERQEQITKAIFSAKIKIIVISDKSKPVKDSLLNFLTGIEDMFNAEKEGILNEERIKNAEKAVAEAEAKKGTDELENYIRPARLRISIIKNDSKVTEIKIKELTARLDILEGKTPGESTDKPGSNKPGTGKPGGDSNINKIPTNPYPSSDRFTGVTQPKWGETKELKKKSPTIKLPKRR